MDGDADIAALGALLSDSSRCRLLLALADGRTLAASVLASEAGVSRSTASEHLGKLLDAELLRVEAQGRHRYYRLAGPHVGRLLEALAVHAPPAPVRSLREGTRAYALRRARYCYDHLGGRLGVALMDALLEREVLVGGDEYRLTGRGERWLHERGLDLAAIRAQRRPLIRYCTDWSEQRHHLAGGLGAALAKQLFAREWLRPARRGRAVSITRAGVDGLADEFGVVLD
jgi:DNA-binding transcriptional ArsR family regulator